MPFSPLPIEFTQLLTHLQALPAACILDLGSGQGEFSHLFSEFDIPVWGLDRLPLEAGIVADIRGDALNPPILPGSLDCLVAGNLVRHLLVQDTQGTFLANWLKLLRPGGCIFLFEDEPGSTVPAEKNFKDLQEFLSRLMPRERGPLVSLEHFRKLLHNLTAQQIWEFGIQKNENSADEKVVIRLLAGETTELSPESVAGKLSVSIEDHGLSYGSFWWAFSQKGELE